MSDKRHAGRSTAEQTSKDRAAWIDMARGIGIILVVYGHILGGLVRARLFPDAAPAHWMDYTLYTFHMPLFFVLAGLNVEHSLKRGRTGFLLNKVWTIVWPYILWSIVQATVIMSFAHDTNIPITTADLAAIWYRPMAQFWFLYALMICHLLAALLPGRRALIVVAALGFAAFMLLPRDPGLRDTLHDLPFYVAGLRGGRIIKAWTPSTTTGLIVLLLAGVAFTLSVAVGGTLSGMDSAGLWSLPACLCGIAMVVVLAKLLDARRHAWLVQVGLMSMTIYILHLLTGSGMRLVMLKLHAPDSPWLYLWVGTIAGVLLPMAAHVALQRLGLLAPLGLAPLRSRFTAGRANGIGRAPLTETMIRKPA